MKTSKNFYYKYYDLTCYDFYRNEYFWNCEIVFPTKYIHKIDYNNILTDWYSQDKFLLKKLSKLYEKKML